MVTSNVGELIARIQSRTAALAPSSPQLKEALLRIGLYVTSVAKLNVRRQNLIDTGRLINSIRYEFFKDGPIEGIRVGSFSVPYAAVHEFGYRGSVSVSSHQRTISQAYGRAIESRRITVRDYRRNANIPRRPYLRPAIVSSRLFIVDTLRQALLFANQGR